MTKKKSFLGLYLIIPLVLIIVAVVLSLTIGMSLSTDIGGGTQFEVKIENTEKVASQSEAIKDALKKHGYSVEKIFVEDKEVETAIVVRVDKKDIKEEVKQTIADKLGISVDQISDFQNINGLVTKKAVLWFSVTIVALLCLVFVGGWLRYKVVAGLSLVFVALISMLMPVALFIITRIPVSFISIVIVMLGVALSLFASALCLERVRESIKLKHNDGKTAGELVEMGMKSTMKPLLFFGVLIFVMSLVMICIPVRFVTMIALSIMLCLLTSAYSYFVGMNLHASLLDIKITRDQARLSKNPNFVSTEKQKEEKERVKAEKQKVKEDRAKAKARKEKLRAKKEADKDIGPVV